MLLGARGRGVSQVIQGVIRTVTRESPVMPAKSFGHRRQGDKAGRWGRG